MRIPPDSIITLDANAQNTLVLNNRHCTRRQGNRRGIQVPLAHTYKITDYEGQRDGDFYSFQLLAPSGSQPMQTG